MHSTLVESPIDARHREISISDSPFLYESILRDSTDRYLSQIRSNTCDFSAFRSVFCRLIQSRSDPPLQIVWFYAAAVYHEVIASKRDVLGRIGAVKDLLQLLIVCLPSSEAAKSVGLVAPVVAELCHAVAEADSLVAPTCGDVKEARKARRELEKLVDGVMGYVSICSGEGFREGMVCADSLPCFQDVVRVWTVRSAVGGSEMEWFFPLASDEVRNWFNERGHRVDDLAAVVAAQTFLLRLLTKLEGGGSEMLNELKAWVVGVLTGLPSFTFFEVLMRLLLDSKLPTFPLSSGKHEASLRQILYDSILLAEYSFLCPAKDFEKPPDSLTHLALLRLFVFHKAIQDARKNDDHKKAIAYTNAFSRSSVPVSLVQWANKQTGRSRPIQVNAATPQALIKWLFSLRKQGFEVLEGDALACFEKLHFYENFRVTEDHLSEAISHPENEELYLFDTKGDVANDGAEEDVMDLTGEAFASAARAMNLDKSDSKKRKGEKGKKGKTEVKYTKYKLHDPTIKNYFVSTAPDVSSGSELENAPNEEVDEMEE